MRRHLPDALVVTGLGAGLLGLYLAFGTLAAPLLVGGLVLFVYGVLLELG